VDTQQTYYYLLAMPSFCLVTCAIATDEGGLHNLCAPNLSGGFPELLFASLVLIFLGLWECPGFVKWHLSRLRKNNNNLLEQGNQVATRTHMNKQTDVPKV
jgi:hypothetical protein